MPRGLLIAIALLVAGDARAETGEPPWSRGVTAEAKTAAQKLLEQGNELFLANRYKEALAKYEAAIAKWDHPAIRFNMVRAQVALDRPIDAFDNLQRALAFGAGPLEDSVFQEAQNYERLLVRQVSHLEVRCDQRDVAISLDGEALLSCPGTAAVRRTPGKHLLIGTARGLETSAREVVLIGGEKETVAVHLDAPRVLTEPRWARWKPWVVIASGAVLAGVGVVFNLRARQSADDVDRRSIASCPEGCSEARYAELGLADLEAKVTRDNRISLTALGIGGAAIVIGGALVVLNRRVVDHATVTAGPGGVSLGYAARF